MGQHRHEHGNALGRIVGERGQSTIEFAVVTAGVVALVVGLGAFWSMLDDGLIVQHALAGASHRLGGVPLQFLADIFKY